MMTDEDVKKVVQLTVSEAVPKAVDDALTKYGINSKDPIEVQKDQAFLSRWRKRIDSAAGKAYLVVVAGLLGVSTQVFGAGFVEYLKTILS